MQSLKLIHIGDVHYPERSDESAIDWKDKAIAGTLVHQLTPDPFKNVADAIRRLWTEDIAVKGVLISGDLTSRGDIDGYKKCVAFLERILDLKNPAISADRIIAVVPGNHDVPRGDIDPTGLDLLKKFERTTEIWDDVRRGIFTPAIVRAADVTVSGISLARVIALNTCIGCGEKRYLPEAVRDELHSVLARYASVTPDPKRFELIGEQLDTPAILESHVVELEASIQKPPLAVAIVLGHHALLPQSRVRVDLYTELLNGGRFRASLATLGVNVIYCHGHLHEDPIEVISSPVGQKGRVIVAAAPLFRDGFNVIELFFEDGGQPIGCVIHRYRSESFGSVRQLAPVRISMQRTGHSGSLCDDVCLSIVRELGKQTLRFKDLETRLHSLTEQILRDKLELLEWLDIVDIRNRTDEPVFWHISRVGL